MTDNVVSLAQIKTDADLAKEIRDRLLPVLAEQALVLDLAMENKLNLAYSITPGPDGKHVVGPIQVSRPL